MLRLEIAIRDNKYDDLNVPINERVYKINRQSLRCLIFGELECSNRKTVYSFIDILLGKGIINPNPTSQISTYAKKIMPTNDTKYFMNKEEIIKELNKNHKILDTHTLSSFTNK